MGGGLEPPFPPPPPWLRYCMEPRVVYSADELLSDTHKDVMLALQNSNVIYQFLCHCNSRYVGRTVAYWLHS